MRDSRNNVMGGISTHIHGEILQSLASNEDRMRYATDALNNGAKVHLEPINFDGLLEYYAESKTTSIHSALRSSSDGALPIVSVSGNYLYGALMLENNVPVYYKVPVSDLRLFKVVANYKTGSPNPEPRKSSAKQDKEKLAQTYPHYYRSVKHLDYIDVYDVLDLFGVDNPCLKHAIKKLLNLGARGHKTRSRDFQDAMDTLERYRIMMEEKEGINE